MIRAFATALLALVAASIFWVLVHILFVSEAHAESARNCASRDVVLERLAGKYGESLRMMALGSNGTMVEVMASGGGETWAILVTRPTGLTCLIASGTDFEVMESPSPPLGDKT